MKNSDVCCAECHFPLAVQEHPEGIIAQCDHCDPGCWSSFRCPACGGKLDNQVGYRRDKPGQPEIEVAYECRTCMVVHWDAEVPVWPLEIVQFGRFRLEIEELATSHPDIDLGTASRWICKELDAARSGGANSDMFLLVLRIAERTSSRVSPLPLGWRIEGGEQAVVLTFDCRVGFMSMNDAGMWHAEEYDVDLGHRDVLGRIFRWLGSDVHGPVVEGD